METAGGGIPPTTSQCSADTQGALVISMVRIGVSIVLFLAWLYKLTLTLKALTGYLTVVENPLPFTLQLGNNNNNYFLLCYVKLLELWQQSHVRPTVLQTTVLCRPYALYINTITQMVAMFLMYYNFVALYEW